MPGINQKDLIAEVKALLGVGHNRTRRLLARLVNEGLLIEAKSSKNAKLYSLP